MLTLVANTGESVSVDSRLFLQKSSYYKAFVSSGMRDAESKIIKFGALSKASLDEVHNFFIEITGTTDDNSLRRSFNIDAGLEAASYLQIDEMVKKYSLLLTSGLHSSTCFHALDLCQMYGLLNAREVVLGYICSNLEACSREEEFLSLTQDEILHIVKSDATNAESEVMIFDAMMKWLSNEPLRAALFPKLLNEIRFELMDEMELRECKTSLNSLNVEATFVDPILEERRGRRPRLRCAVEGIVALGGFTSKELSTNQFQVVTAEEMMRALKPERRKVSNTRSSSTSTVSFKSSKRHKLPVTLCEHGVCVLNGSLYVAGGQVRYYDDGRLTTNQVRVFDPVRQMWSACAEMNVPRSLFHFGELGGCIYAVSGCTAFNADTATVERYLPDRDVWEMVASLEVRVHELAGCSLGGYLYISGGFRGPDRGHVDLVWKYDSVADLWVPRASLLKRRSYHAMAAVNDKIYVVGGAQYMGSDRFEDILDGEMYDPLLDQWSRVIRLNYPASCMSMIVVEGHLLLFGGHSFVYDRDHDFIQAISLAKYEGVGETLEHVGASPKSREIARNCCTESTLECQILKFKAHNIYYFSLSLMTLPKKFVEQFH